MKNFVLGIVIGLVLGGGIGWAADRYIKLQSSNGIAISAANPLPIQIN